MELCRLVRLLRFTRDARRGVLGAENTNGFDPAGRMCVVAKREVLQKTKSDSKRTPPRKRKVRSWESESKPGIDMVYPEPCKELRRRISAAISGKGIVPY